MKQINLEQLQAVSGGYYGYHSQSSEIVGSALAMGSMGAVFGAAAAGLDGLIVGGLIGGYVGAVFGAVSYGGSYYHGPYNYGYQEVVYDPYWGGYNYVPVYVY